jgi:transketolase
VQKADSGHPGAPIGMADVAYVLWTRCLRFDAAAPTWPDRDRFVLSKGHAAIGLYPVLADLGYFDPADLDDYTRLGSRFGDHPDMRKIPGVDFSSGSLGHGLSIAVGIALAGRVHGSDHRTWCILGDGELAEGQIWEAAMAAGHYQLGNLVAVVDRNQMCIDGFTDDVMTVEPLDARCADFGWPAQRIAGHDLDATLNTFSDLPRADPGQPQVIIADTIKGRGVARMELSLDWHVGNLVGDDYDDVMRELEPGLGREVAR